MQDFVLDYPLDVNGVRLTWSDWDIIREIQQEFMDLSTNWRVWQDALGTHWAGNTPRFEPVSLVIGKSLKRERGMETVGRFGDGTKNAFAVALRSGYNVLVESHDISLKPEIVSKDFLGQTADIMRVTISERTCPDDHQTIYHLIGYHGDLFTRKFILPGEVPLSQHDGIALHKGFGFFLRGMWVNDGQTYNAAQSHFKYNFDKLPITEDRSLTDTWQVSHLGEKFWNSETDQSLMAEFITAVRDTTCAEQYMYLNPKDMTYWIKAMKNVLGPSLTRKGEDAHWIQEAEYLGVQWYKDISALKNIALQTYPDAKEHSLSIIGANRSRRVKLAKLSPNEQGMLRQIKKYVLKVFPDAKISVIEMDMLGRRDENMIEISPKVLQMDLIEGLAVMIHELAHWRFGSQDATASMVDSCCAIAAQLIVGE